MPYQSFFFKGTRDRSWVHYGDYSKDNAIAELRRMGTGWMGYCLWKEFTSLSQANAFATELNTFSSGGVGSLLQYYPTADNLRVAPRWSELPWLETDCYPAALRVDPRTGQNRLGAIRSSGAPFRNGGQALLFAAQYIVDNGSNMGGTCYPTVCYNPSPENYIFEIMREFTMETAPRNHASIKDMAGRTFGSCSTCGRLSHHAPACTFPPKIHDKIGIEIEGRWANLPAMQTLAASITTRLGNADGSVLPDVALGHSPWEFQTLPSTLGSALSQLITLFPDSSDISCGMHVHMSFPVVDTGLLYQQDFFDYFKARWKAWGEREQIHPGHQFWSRLNGSNEYCHVNTYRPNESLLRMDRYHQLNWRAYAEHKTLECRLLPMFRRQSLCVSAISELVDIYETYLHQESLGDKLHKEDVLLPAIKPNPWVEKKEMEVRAEGFKFALRHELELAELPPVSAGMKRIALPVGRVAPSTAHNPQDLIKRLTTTTTKKAG